MVCSGELGGGQLLEKLCRHWIDYVLIKLEELLVVFVIIVIIVVELVALIIFRVIILKL